jgi:AcrR family transcriptional regulator
MARWEPNARERLQAVALELFEERGYDRTTVGDIAARANLTERTFFRYFADKREVLFSGSEDLEKLLVDGIAAAPGAMAALDVVVAALGSASPFFETRRAFAGRRQALITAHPELHERELIKLTTLGATIVASLRERGVSPLAAGLLAQTSMMLFQAAFESWIADTKKRDLAHHLGESLAELRRLTAETGAVGPAPSPRSKSAAPRAKSASAKPKPPPARGGRRKA